MEREIKFRGIPMNSDKFIFGSLIQQSVACYIFYENYITIEVKPETVGQYTGLKDKNGKEIYEGDIVSVDDGVLGIKLIVERYKTGFELHQRHWGARLFECAEYGTVYILGNIHENPELL